MIPWPFHMHLWIMRGLWNLWNAGIVLLVIFLPATTAFPTGLRIAGMALVLLGLILNIWHRMLLGRERFMGGRCFERKYDTRTNGGLYRYLQNPIYDGIIMTFIGLAIWRENSGFLLLAVATFLFLNVFIGIIEGSPSSSSPHTK
jgi:protein-S-isoprenylcysteine O-methyltransferase Ste14